MAKNRNRDNEAVERYLEKLRLVREHTSFNPFETREEQQACINRAKKDVDYFVDRYFKHYATAKSADFHIELASYVKQNAACKVLVRWGRGLAKSVWCNIIIPLWLWVNDDIGFMVVVGNNFDKAKMLLQDLQVEFEANQLLIRDFGVQEMAGNWEKGFFRTKNGFIAKALGMGQSPRGLRVFAKRPDYISCDDLEDQDTENNPKRQKAIKKWIERSLLPTMDGKNRRYVHPNNNPFPISIQGLLEEAHPEWKLHRVDACPTADRKPRWSAKYDKDYYKELEIELTTLVLEAEYNNKPHKEGEVFKDSFITWDNVPRINHYQHIIAYWDVAYSASDTADYNAVKVWGLKDNRFYLIKAFVRQCEMTDAIRWMFDYQASLPISINFYFESQFWNKALQMDYTQVSKEKGNKHIALIKDDRKKGNKYDRMLTMLPHYQQGRIIYNIKEKANNDMQVGKAQLLGIEPGYKSKDDSPDADEGAIEILSKHITLAQSAKESTFGGERRPTKF